LPRTAKVTPGYGHLDYSILSIPGQRQFADQEILMIERSQFTPGKPSPPARKFKSFDETGRYIIAYYYKAPVYGMGGSGRPEQHILIDNHGQKHIGGISFVFDARYEPLPDILIDQIKLVADIMDENYFAPLLNWSPKDHIKNILAI